ncbi:MAG TPA: VWA domain-containing protein [Woeseiaceae bacterium]|nr:VWA domain-containing protein [Woeseiaceae bacterium]
MDDPGRSRLAETILLFCRALRHAGLPVGPGAVIDALAAVAATGIQKREDFAYALRCVLVNDPAQFRLFDQTFHICFRNPLLLAQLLALPLVQPGQATAVAAQDAGIRRLLESLTGSSQAAADDDPSSRDRAGSYSAREILRHKDFAQMSLEEVAEAQRLLREESNIPGTCRSRRFRAGTSGRRYDLRRSMQLMLRCHGQPVQLARKSNEERQHSLVLLCDISGSMSIYSRMFLLYAHTLAAKHRRVHTFVFGTRLTNISRWLRDRDADQAMQKISAQVHDWDGGTRIAESLQQFNLVWSRRVLESNANVVLLCDGLERGSGAELAFQMQRLKRGCRQLIWMNPLLSYRGFEAKASGIRAMRPHVDRFVTAHNLASLDDLRRLLAETPPRRTVRALGVAA